MNLKEQIALIEEKRAEAAVSPEDADPRVRAGVEAVVRNAKRDLEDLEKNFKESVMANVVLIAVEGDGGAEFANVARIAFDALTVNYDLIVSRITTNLKDRSGRTEFSTQEFFMVMDELNKAKLDYGMLSLPAPKVNAAIDQVYNRPPDEAVRNLLKINYDEQLSSIVARREIGQAALNVKFSGKHLPVVLYNYHGVLDEQFLPRPIVTVSVGVKDVTKELVKEVLMQVKSRLTISRSPRKKITTTETTIEQTAEQTEEQTN